LLELASRDSYLEVKMKRFAYRINREGVSSSCSPPGRLTKDSLNRDMSENVSLPRKLRCRRFRTHPASLDIIAVN